MAKAKTNKEYTYRLLVFWSTVAIILSVVAIGAGAICVDQFGWNEAWALTLLTAGLALFLVNIAVLIVFIILLQRLVEETAHELGVYLGKPGQFQVGKVKLSFLDDGLLVEGDEVTDGEQLIPYERVILYRTMRRRVADSKPQERLFLRIPDVFKSTNFHQFCFREGKEIYLSYEFRNCLELAASAEIHKLTIIDKRTERMTHPVYMKRFLEDKGKVNTIIGAMVTMLGVLLLGVAVMIGLKQYAKMKYTNGLAWALGGCCVPVLVVMIYKAITGGITIKIYRDGITIRLRESSKTEKETTGFGFWVMHIVYFPLSEIEKITRAEAQTKKFVNIHTGYSVWSVPDIEGLFAFLSEKFPDKCEEEKDEE